jgi:hypothetical protein
MKLKAMTLTKAAARSGWVCAAGIFLALAIPRPANAQFGLDLAAILAGLQKVSNLLTSSIASPLKKIQSVEQDMQKYQEEVLYPIQEINRAKALASSLSGQMRSMQSLINLNFASATLMLPQQLERQMLSGNSNYIAGFQNSYSQVYGSLPIASAAPPDLRSRIDMTDAQAQDAMKKAIELDALATRELEVAQSLNQQIQTAAPGTASILEAEGSAWVLQGNAYSQSAMAALLRVRSTELSNAGSEMKSSTSQTQQFNQNMLGIIHPK